jgi:hypothetical protein
LSDRPKKDPLAPVIRGLAELYGLHAAQITTESNTRLVLASNWILLTRGTSPSAPEISRLAHPIERKQRESQNSLD